MDRAAFLDEAVIEVAGGRGGNGSASFRRTKHNPKGGPDGGDGGNGGDVYARTDLSMAVLHDYVAKRRFEAERGERGGSNRRHGKNGGDLVLSMPVGTDIYEAETGIWHATLMNDGERVKLAGGGQGGRGNVTFKSATNRAPREFTEGRAGEARSFHLALRLLADVGIVGMPNAGKSTFLNLVSGAHAKTGDYPFTTLRPQLGVVELPDFEQLTFADLPGIIEGASEGAGLGARFLRHASRTKVLLHMVDASEGDAALVLERMETLQGELGRDTEAGGGTKPHVLALAKVDALDKGDVEAMLGIVREMAAPTPVRAVSSYTGEGVEELVSLAASLAREVSHVA